MTRVKKVYTYILKDIDEGTYKIGKTTSPHQRFKSLCKPGEVVPIALIDKDVEVALHFEFRKNRVMNPKFTGNGGTEWFKKGGKFTKFIEEIDTGSHIPFISVHSMVTRLIEQDAIVIPNEVTLWEIDQSGFARHNIGLIILRVLQYVSLFKGILTGKNKEDVFIIGHKIAVSEKVIKFISEHYKIYLSYSMSDPIIKDNINKEKFASTARKVMLDTKDKDSGVFLLLNKVL